MGGKRKLTGLLVILLVLCFCGNLLPAPALAAKYHAYAEKLAKLDVFRGTGEGFELEREPTRLEGLVMLVRLLGAEEKAKQITTYTFPFDDVPNWGKGYVQYAYENGLTKGVSRDKFGTNSIIDAKSYMTFLLRALGYSDQRGDFPGRKPMNLPWKRALSVRVCILN